MENKFTKIRDSILKEKKWTLTQKEKDTISAIINNIIACPSILEKDIENWESNDIEKDKEIVNETYNILNELQINNEFIKKILDIKNNLKNWEVLTTNVVKNLYKKLKNND